MERVRENGGGEEPRVLVFSDPDTGEKKKIKYYELSTVDFDRLREDHPLRDDLSGVEVVVSKASDGACAVEPFRLEVLNKMKPGGLIVADDDEWTKTNWRNNPDLEPGRLRRIEEAAGLVEIPLTEELRKDILGGIRFGYPSAGVYAMGVPLVVYKKTKGSY